MQANPDDQLTRHSPGGGFPVKPVLLGLAALVILAAIFWPREDTPPVEPDSSAASSEPQAPLPTARDIPEPEPAPEPEPEPAEEPATEPVDEPEPLPPLEESDPVLRESMETAGIDNSVFQPLAEQDNLVSTLGALVDGTSRGVILRKLLPVDPPETPFQVMETDDGTTVIDPAGYQRYNPYALAIAGLDTDTMAEQFHRLRPLFEAGWEQLGLDPEEFDNAVMRTLDRILATPELEGPVALEQESVMYTYADPELESLPSLQKQLLRMGPANLRLIKTQARALRDALLGGQ